MGFLKLLQGIGDRIGILEAVSAPGAKPGERIRTRIVTLEELACEIRSVEVRALADEPAEITSPPEKIFETAGIAPGPSAWSVDRLKDFIQSELGKNKSRGEIQKSVLGAMNSDGATAGDVVKDAVSRDRALDAFEESAEAKMHERAEAVEKRIRDLESKAEQLRQEADGIKKKFEAQKDEWKEWKRQKRAYEKQLASVIAYIVDHKVITTDD
jgi:hypothetical protein